MIVRGTSQRRGRLALAIAVLWVLAYEVMPWLHVALHDRIGHHHHDASGALVADLADDHVDEVDHDHDDHDHARPDRHDEGDGAKLLARALQHGRHSAAHHDLASLPAPLVLTSPLPIDRRPITLAATVVVEPVSFCPGRAVARGPPVELS